MKWLWDKKKDCLILLINGNARVIRTVTIQEICSLTDETGLPWLPDDVRSSSELCHTGRLIGAYHVHLTELQERMDEAVRWMDILHGKWPVEQC